MPLMQRSQVPTLLRELRFWARELKSLVEELRSGMSYSEVGGKKVDLGKRGN